MRLPDVFRAVAEAIDIVSKGNHDPMSAHGRVRNFYDWSHVTARTEKVYDAVIKLEPRDLSTRIQR